MIRALKNQIKKSSALSSFFNVLIKNTPRFVGVRLKFAEIVLPTEYFIQCNPDFNTVREMNYYPDFKSDRMIYDEIAKADTKDGTRLLNGKLLLDLVHNLPEGDYAELGTFQGNFARIIYKFMNRKAHFYCFDTFEGFNKKDVDIEAKKNGIVVQEGHFGNTSVELVRNNILKGEKFDNLYFKKGFFPSTFAGMESSKWRFVHLDADLYEPMKEALIAFWPRLVKGGVLLIHDYNGNYFGTKQAVDEYFKPLGIIPTPLSDKVGSVVVIKNS